jgi:multiple sugar transport system substrate-binding protein
MLIGLTAATLGGAFAAACSAAPGGTPAKPATSLPPQAVEFWGPDPKTDTGMAAVVDAFRAKYPNLNLSVSGGALNITAESREKFIAATVAGNPPDTTYQDRWIPQSYVVWGALVTIDDRIKNSRVRPDEWWPYIRKDVTLKGKIVGVPIHTDARVFMWNKEHFQELGLNPDRPPASWDDLAAISARLVKRGPDGKLVRAGFMPWGGVFGTHGLPFLVHLWQAGGQTLSDDQRKVRFHEPPGVKAMEWMMAVARQIGGSAGYAELSQGMASGTGLDQFSTGRLSMQQAGNSNYVTYLRNVPNLKFGVSEIPIPAGGQPSSYTGGFAVCISKNAQHPDAAWAFLEHWMGDDEMQFIWSDMKSLVPGVRRIAESERFLKADPYPEYRVRDYTNKSVRSARWGPTRAGIADYRDQFNPRIMAAGTLSMPATAVLEDLAQQCQLALDTWEGRYPGSCC